MKERPILMSAPMVRSLLACTKSQTRRIVKPKHLHFFEQSASDMLGQWRDRPLPYGKTGDRLWVRENGWQRPERTPRMMRDGADTWAPYYFDADGYDNDADREQFKTWGFQRRPSIHMPRWASRITLEITGVRVERLQNISEADARTEGINCYPFLRPYCGMPVCDGYTHEVDDGECDLHESAVIAYRWLWESIHGTGSWDKNPWVWVVEFRNLS